MKKRKWMLGSAIMLAVLLIAGGTLAWFTATADPVTNEFTAGTLKIDLVDNFEGAPNVNPGDCYEKEVYVENTGSKKALVRIAKNMFFDNDDLDVGVVNYELGDGWVEDEDGFFYYDTILEAEESTGPLFADNSICFDGEGMGNEYQGSKFSIVIEAEAIQTTNGAPTDQGWAFDPLLAQ